MITITTATTAADLAAVRALCWDYRDFLLNVAPQEREITQAFYPTQKYQSIMDTLAQAHARPQGIILLAQEDGAPVGCGMSHALDPQTCEIKRVFTTPSARGKGVARKICKQLMDQARADGFARVMLDTSINLMAAQALYASLGFTKRGPYQPVPDEVLPDLVFFEATL